MTWTQPMRTAARRMALATGLFTAFSLVFLWLRARAMEVAPWEFFAMALIVTIIWFAIGAVMTIYIVMIIHKNTKEER